ncbi:hypothetical protein [Methylobacterium sp. ap11]|uniref:hypothetical protein n=1 Tax=Methylobacterium sp. ap11 TaxID=1761799 RepID=UPI001160AEEF|nr:hypothetical protein [Methylobacterium sp. ap11]
MNMFHISKLILATDLAEFLEMINAFGECFIVRETHIDAGIWLLCVGCAYRDAAGRVRLWQPSSMKSLTDAPFAAVRQRTPSVVARPRN